MILFAKRLRNQELSVDQNCKLAWQQALSARLVVSKIESGRNVPHLSVLRVKCYVSVAGLLC